MRRLLLYPASSFTLPRLLKHPTLALPTLRETAEKGMSEMGQRAASGTLPPARGIRRAASGTFGTRLSVGGG